MLFRWDSITEDIKLFISKVKQLVRKVLPKRKEKRGRPPKHSLVSYITLLVAKEYEKKILRGAEARLSELICKERVGHSVISYWENKPEISCCINQIINEAGYLLDEYLGYTFSVIDSTKFSSWYMDEIEFHVLNRINEETVYPASISFLRGSLAAPVKEVLQEGTGNLYADAGYDDNTSIGIMFEREYIPIVCPNKNRWKGYHRKKARKLYRMIKNRLGYRQRGRGESPFGSLTNAYGDRIKTLSSEATITRIASRVLCYQVRLLMRITAYLL